MRIEYKRNVMAPFFNRGSVHLSLSPSFDQWVRGGRRATHNGESSVRLRHHLVGSSFHHTTGPGSSSPGPGES
ncbi:leucine-rich repeat LGI family member 3 [Sarotherodon galilaeus]